ncbi:hypothetical protein GCM10027073_70110 [Streptomyces chlorus]
MDIGEVRIAVVSENGVARAANPLTHVAAHLAEADETELHQLCSLGCDVAWRHERAAALTYRPDPKPGRSRTSVGIRAHAHALTCGFTNADRPAVFRRFRARHDPVHTHGPQAGPEDRARLWTDAGDRGQAGRGQPLSRTGMIRYL